MKRVFIVVDLGEFKIPQKEHRHEPGKTEG